MINSVSYFKKHFKDSLKAILYVTGVSLIISMIIGYNTQEYTVYPYAGAETVTYAYSSTLYISVSILCILCYVVPVLQFSVFKKRRNLDCFYAMPISRKALGMTHYTVGLITVLIPFTVCYIQNFLMLIIRGADLYYTPMIAHFFLCVLFGVIMYSFSTFVFNQGSSVGDGCVFMALWSFILMFAEGAVITLSKSFSDMFFKFYYGIPWTMIDLITADYQVYIEKHAKDPLTVLTGTEDIVWLVLWCVICILSVVGFYFFFGKEGPEKTEEISDSYFGYRTLIPLYAVLGFLSMPYFVFAVIIEAFAFVGYTIYRKGFHFKKSDIIVLASYPVFTILIDLLLHS